MPIFAFEHGKIRDLYVLGDVHGLIGRMKGLPISSFLFGSY